MQSSEDAQIVHRSKDSATEQEGSSFYCKICLDRAEDPVGLPCRHLFCRKCVDKWWRAKYFDAPQRMCPICFAVIRSDNDVLPYKATSFVHCDSTPKPRFNDALQPSCSQLDDLDLPDTQHLQDQIRQPEEGIRCKDANFEKSEKETHLQVHQLQERNGQLQKDIEILKMAKDDLQNDLNNVRVELEDNKEETIRLLEQQLREKDDELERIKLHEEEREKFLSALQEDLDQLNNTLQQKDSEIADVTKARNDFATNLGEHRQWLADANNRIDDLVKDVEEKAKTFDGIKEELNELREKQVEYDRQRSEVEQLHDKIKRLEDELRNGGHIELTMLHPEELSSLRDRASNLQHEVDEKNACINDLTKQKNDADWSLAEYLVFLDQANDRIKWLEDECRKKDEDHKNVTKQLQQDAGELETRAQYSESEVVGKSNTIDSLNAALDEKNRIIDVVTKERDDFEWYLKENKQWLADARERIEELEKLLKEKQEAIQQATSKEHGVVKMGTQKQGAQQKDQEREDLLDRISELQVLMVEEHLAGLIQPETIDDLSCAIVMLRSQLD